MTPASGSRSRPWRRSRSEYSRRGSAWRKPSRGRSASRRAARGLGPPARGEQYEQTPPAEARLHRGVAMNFGVWIPNCRHLATPDIIRSTAVRAEQLGYDSLWVSDHVVVPHANVKNFGETVFDPLVTLAVAAGATRRVRLGTTVLIVPYRNAVVTAKMIGSLEELRAGLAEIARLCQARGRATAPALTLRNDVRILRPGQSAPASTHAGRVLAGEPNALVDQVRELAGLGVEHLVLEFLAADGRELDEQLALFAERVRPGLT